MFIRLHSCYVHTFHFVVIFHHTHSLCCTHWFDIYVTFILLVFVLPFFTLILFVYIVHYITPVVYLLNIYTFVCCLFRYVCFKFVICYWCWWFCYITVVVALVFGTYSFVACNSGDWPEIWYGGFPDSFIAWHLRFTTVLFVDALIVVILLLHRYTFHVTMPFATAVLLLPLLPTHSLYTHIYFVGDTVMDTLLHWFTIVGAFTLFPRCSLRYEFWLRYARLRSRTILRWCGLNFCRSRPRRLPSCYGGRQLYLPPTTAALLIFITPT